MLELTLDNFTQEVEQNAGAVLVDFWAPWCGPCRIQGPIMEELAEDLVGKPVKVAKLNVDEVGDVAQKYGIISIPTIILFERGHVKEQYVGVHQKDMLLEKLQPYLS